MNVDKEEVLEFVAWLPPIAETEAYLIQLMIRSSAMKKELGFKGSDHVLMFKTAHGYLNQTDPRFGWEFWRTRLYYNILRMAELMKDGLWEYARHKPGTRIIEEVYEIPKEVLALYVQINPSNAVRAAASTVKEVMNAFASLITSSEPFWKLYRRPDTRYHSNMARHHRTIFHVVDVDDKRYVKELGSIFKEAFGYIPDMIITARGVHFLVNLEELRKEGLRNVWEGPLPKELARKLSEWKQTKKESLRVELEEIALKDSNVPLYHRIAVLQEVTKDERGASLVELKKQGLEPVPGIPYKGTIPRLVVKH